MTQIRLHILVATARNGQDNDIVLLELHLLQGCHSMGTFDSRDNTLHTGQFISCIDSLIIFDGKHMTAATGSQVGMHRSDAWIIQTGTDGEGV